MIQNQQPISQPLVSQSPRVANVLQATGRQATSSAFTKRFSSPAQLAHQLPVYASSAPSPSSSLNLQTQSRPIRISVPLFNHGPTSSVPAAKMNLGTDVDLDDFPAFEGGASTTAFSSPALPTVLDLGSNTSGSTANVGTVSPQDLLIHDPIMSTPNSTTLTTLTSPSVYNESPEFDVYDVSPSFGSADLDVGSADAWFPLFPQANPEPPKPKPVILGLDPEKDAQTLGHRRKPLASSPPGRHSAVAGVSSRRRDKPLPPIIVEDPTDVVAMKRARNTLAARKSRERKAQRLEQLEADIVRLTQERDYWKALALAHGAKEE